MCFVRPLIDLWVQALVDAEDDIDAVDQLQEGLSSVSARTSEPAEHDLAQFEATDVHVEQHMWIERAFENQRDRNEPNRQLLMHMGGPDRTFACHSEYITLVWP